jgi:hypothetical protein
MESEKIHGKTQGKVLTLYPSALLPAKFLLYCGIGRLFKD